MPEPLDTGDLSPALGGRRAAPDEPLVPPPGPEPAAGMPNVEAEALRAELDALLGAEGAEVIEALSQIGTLGIGLTHLFTSTLQTLETHLPETLAAFEGLVDALGQAASEALDPLFDPDENA